MASVEIANELAIKSEIEYDPENPEFNPNTNSTEKPVINGNIEFKDVWFKYPTRDQYVLKKINLKIE